MKRILLCVMAFVGFAIPANAGFFDKQSDAVWVRYVTPSAIVNSTATLVIDKSDTTNFPHKTGKALEILAVEILVDQVAAGTSTVKVGVLTSVNASSGTVNWFVASQNALNVSNTENHVSRYWVPSGIRTEVVDGNTPYFLSREKTTVTPVAGQPLLFQTDIPLFSPRNVSVAPGVGDVVAEIQAGASNGAIVDIGVLYNGLP